MGSLEKDLMKLIIKKLGVYHLTGEVIWWGRLNSLRVKTIYGGIVHGHPKGTPDILVLIRNRENGVTVLFLEAKSIKGKLRPEQEGFIDKYNRIPDVYVLEIREIKQLMDWIEKHAKDYVNLLPKEL